MNMESIDALRIADKLWAKRFRERDKKALEELKQKIEESRKKHPAPKTIVYAPPEPDTPPPAGTTKINTAIEMPLGGAQDD